MIKYLLAAILILCAIYGGVEARPLLTGPILTVASPAQNESYPGGIVAVQGTVLHAAELAINGSPVLHDQNGDFSSTLTFPRGGSILTITATDRFGKTVTVTRSIFVP
jgi:Glucodextranase, domain B